MTPGKYDLALYRGDSYRWTFALWEDDTKTTPVNLASAVAAAEIRDKAGGAKVLTLACAITVPNTIDVTLDADQWATAPTGLTAWDLEVTFTDGTVSTYVAGKVTVTGDITNSIAVAR